MERKLPRSGFEPGIFDSSSYDDNRYGKRGFKYYK